MSGAPTPRAAQLKAPPLQVCEVGADEHGAGQRIAAVGDDDVRNPDIGADIVEALDAELLDELAPGHWAPALTRSEAGAR